MFHTSMFFTQVLILGDDVLWCSQEGLMQEASEAPTSLCLNSMFSWHHLLVPWNTILPSRVMLCCKEKLIPKPAAQLLPAEAHWAVLQELWAQLGTLQGLPLREQEAWESLLWSAFPAWTALFSLLSLRLS